MKTSERNTMTNHDVLLSKHDYLQDVLIQSEEFNFHVFDSKHRAIGCHVRITRETLVDTEPDDFVGYTDKDPGVYFRFFGIATRDGKSYGASHSWPLRETIEAAFDDRRRYLDGATKRAGKLSAKAGI